MGGFDETEDREVIRSILDGRPDDFEVLVERYSRYVFKIVSGIVPQDMVQELAHEVFVESYRSHPKFGGRIPFRKWLAGIATHLCYDYWRVRYRNKEVPMSTLVAEHRQWVEGLMAARSRGAFEGMETRNEAREILQWAMSGLAAEEKLVLTLVHLEGLSAKEAADILGWSVINVKVRAHRSREKMRKRIAAMVEEAGGR